MKSTKNIIITAKTKLADRPVVWKEAYTERTLFLKKQFHDVLGPGSYFRFEGHDTETDDDYFVVVGPAKVHKPKAEFFAGVRKLPADFSAGGLYFHDLKEAMEYAHDTWGVNSPSEMEYYDSIDLKGISKKVKKWKEEQNEETNNENYLQEWYKNIKKEGNKMPVSDQEYFYAQSSVFPFFTKIAMAPRNKNTPSEWWDIDDIAMGLDSSFLERAEQEPSLHLALQAGMVEKAKYKKQIVNMYGAQYATDNAGFYKIWLVHNDEGTYLVSVGPYCGADFLAAQDKFGVYKLRLNIATQDEVENTILRKQEEYANLYGIVLPRNNFNVSLKEDELRDGTMKKGEISISSKARQKFKDSPAWKKMIMDVYQVSADDPDMLKKLKLKRREIKNAYDAQLKEAYSQSKENGDAFRMQQPPPPSVGLWDKSRIGGQQRPTTILRQNVGLSGLTEGEKIEKFGFDSLLEAVEYLNINSFPGAPIGDVPDTTSEDLRQARELKMNLNQNEITPESIPEIEIKEKKREQKSIPTQKSVPMPSDEIPTTEGAEEIDNFSDLFGIVSHSSLLNMIKMAEELDSRGKTAEAKEIHHMLKKHITL